MTNYGYIWYEYSWRVSTNASQVWGKKETKFAEIQLPKIFFKVAHGKSLVHYLKIYGEEEEKCIPKIQYSLVIIDRLRVRIMTSQKSFVLKFSAKLSSSWTIKDNLCTAEHFIKHSTSSLLRIDKPEKYILYFELIM